MTDVRNFQTGSPQLLPWNDRLCAHRLSAGGTAIYFVALNLGYGLPDFGYYTLYNTIFMLLFYFRC